MFLPAAVCAATGIWAVARMGFPEPSIHDEFSYLLAAETFASGRLANETPTGWEHLETFHVNMRPKYMSIYQPGNGLVLAAGLRLGGHAWYGALLACCALCAAVAWALMGWLPERWAACGGLAAAAAVSFSYWQLSYWGGALAATGGALALGGLARALRGPRLSAGLGLGSGVFLLAITRPYEGVAILAAGTLAALWMLWRSGGVRGANRAWLVRVLVPVALMGFAALSGLLLYNRATTGSFIRTAYTENLKRYMSRPMFFWQKPNIPDPYRHEEMERMYEALHRRDVSVAEVFKFRMGDYAFSLNPLWLALAAVAGGMALRRRRIGKLLVAMMAGSGVACLGAVWTYPHYVGVAMVVLLGFATSGLAGLGRWRVSGKPMGMAIQAVCVILLVSEIALGAHQLAMRGRVIRSWRTWAPTFHHIPEQGYTWVVGEWRIQRRRIESELLAKGGKHLVFVRYDANHEEAFEWVYNAADIKNSPVVWAREWHAEADAELVRAYADRKAWVVEADALLPRLSARTASDQTSSDQTSRVLR